MKGTLNNSNESKKWKELTIASTEEGVEVVLARLDMLGVAQVSIVQGRDEIERQLRDVEKYWDYAEDAVLEAEPAVRAYFSDVDENRDLESAIRESMAELDALRGEIGLDLGSLEISVRLVDEEDWANNWKAYFKPVEIGERLLVCPSWEEPPVGTRRAVLRIDPGMAFGTGTHHTTRMCLELLEKHLKHGSEVADLGCGSGILSICACLLGAAHADAVDIDPVAARVTRENAEENGVDPDRLCVMTGDILSDKALKECFSGEKYDIVLANIVAGVIISLAPLIISMLKPGGRLIASGIIDDRIGDVLSALESSGLRPVEIVCGEAWRAVLAEKA